MSTPLPLPTLVVDDGHASTGELLARAAADYDAAQSRRDQLCHEERVLGYEPERDR